jgi:hypothetical protein
MVTVFYRHRPKPLGHHMLGPLGLVAHESKIVNQLRLVKAATLFLAFFVATNHYSMLQSLDVDVHLTSLKNC